MTEVPKIVHDRLRAAELAHAAGSPSHPDPDLLTALSEQSLLPAERDGILLHLAACADCRELVALALPPEAVIVPGTVETEAVRTPLKTQPGKSWMNAFAWPTLTWAALAAGVVVAGSVLLLHHGNTPAVTPPNQQIAVNPPSAAPQIPQPSAQAPTPARDQTPLEPALSENTKTAGNRAKQPSNADSGILMGDATVAGAKIAGKNIAGEKKDSFRADKLSATRAAAFDSPVPRSMTENVEVSDAAIAPEPVPSTAADLMARNEAPAIEKAKPASPEIVGTQQVALQDSGADKKTVTSAAHASGAALSPAIRNGYVLKKEALAKQAFAPSFKLRIAGGVLQRSVDDGLNWQIGLRSDHLLLCYGILDWDVWAGGETGTLFHSTNGGVTWVPVHPTVKTQPLSTDIVTIKVQGTQVLVSTSNKEVWSSADGGKTWEKK
jgi:hypothetical protein